MDETAARVDGLSVPGSERFEDFYVSTASRVRGTLSVILGNAELAGEATDEAMTRAFERWNRLSRMANPAGWVYRVGLNWAKRQMRRRSYDFPPGARLIATEDMPTPDPQLWDALDRLTTDHKTVLVLRYAEDWSVKQIADALNVATGTVKSRLHRAMNELREELE